MGKSQTREMVPINDPSGRFIQNVERVIDLKHPAKYGVEEIAACPIPLEMTELLSPISHSEVFLDCLQCVEQDNFIASVPTTIEAKTVETKTPKTLSQQLNQTEALTYVGRTKPLIGLRIVWDILIYGKIPSPFESQIIDVIFLDRHPKGLFNFFLACFCLLEFVFWNLQKCR